MSAIPAPENSSRPMPIERHPLRPFFPEGAEILVLGSFPPPRTRWRMEFFYPNYQNDFWRIVGLVFFGDSERFLLPAAHTEAGVPERKGARNFGTAGDAETERMVKANKGMVRKGGFDLSAIKAFLTERGIALYDAGLEVVREKGNASDQHLRIVVPLNVSDVLDRLPKCSKIVLTGEKASETILAQLETGIGKKTLKPGESSLFHVAGRKVEVCRVCSPSRAYPLPIVQKAEIYRKVFLGNRTGWEG